MAWKPKEKELTKDEAVALARSELAPYWHGSRPLLAPVKTADKTTVYPLDDDFYDKVWLIAFLNPTDIAGENVVSFLKEMNKRYSGIAVRCLCVLVPAYKFLRETKLIEALIRVNQIPFPLVLDHDGLLAKTFEISSLPSVLLYAKKNIVVKNTALDWRRNLERELQSMLRANDPGLALLPILEKSDSEKTERRKIEFGHDRGAKFPEPGFVHFTPEFGSAAFSSPRPDIWNQKWEKGEFFIYGRWLQDNDRIITSDPEAEIVVKAETQNFSIVAQSMAKTLEPSKIFIDVDDAPAYEIFKAEDLSFDDEGRSMVRVESPRLYHVFDSLPENKRLISIRFPLADRVPTGLYGFRFIN